MKKLGILSSLVWITALAGGTLVSACGDDANEGGGGGGGSGNAPGADAGDGGGSGGPGSGGRPGSGGSEDSGGTSGGGGSSGSPGSGGRLASGGSPSQSDGGDACGTYCANAMANCTGDNALYPDEDACLATCAAMEEGDPDDTSGNSAWCRAYHAGAPSASDPEMHCPHASASGGGVCGGPCDAYCDQVMAHCADDNALYPDRDSCLATCDAFPEVDAAQATDGNSVQCRVYHASFPSAAAPEMHCGHASAGGGGVCGATCDAYCDQVMAHCTGDNAFYPDRDSCLATCAAFPEADTAQATDGNSAQCRVYHGSFPSAAAPDTHCPHATASGGGVCGEACDAYCDQVMAHCIGDNALYADRDACMTACGAFPSVDDAYATEGNSVQCRVYHGSFPSAGAPETHCPHATPAGGGVCQ